MALVKLRIVPRVRINPLPRPHVIPQALPHFIPNPRITRRGKLKLF